MDLLPHLHERLISSLAVAPPPEEPLTVGQLYQRLIAYRSIRNEVGVMELASYEHALLRLLSGEQGFLRMLDETATAEIRRELASTNPILGIYRDFADVGIELGAEAAGTGEASSERIDGRSGGSSAEWSES